MKTLIFGDTHISKDNINELVPIFDEILSYKADRLICLGDYYDTKTLSTDCLLFGTEVARKIRDKYKEVYFIEGNHDKEIIKYLSSLDFKVDKEFIIDNIFYGHFFVYESKKSFNSTKISCKELRQYKLTLLGHQHSYQRINDTVYHIGSPIYVDFGEVEDENKNIAIIENNVSIIPLYTPIPMHDVHSISELEIIPDRTKVRLIINDFNQLKKESQYLDKYKNKFYQFKLKINFQNNTNTKSIESNLQIKDLINEWINKIQDSEVKQILWDSLFQYLQE